MNAAQTLFKLTLLFFGRLFLAFTLAITPLYATSDPGQSTELIQEQMASIETELKGQGLEISDSLRSVLHSFLSNFLTVRRAYENGSLDSIGRTTDAFRTYQSALYDLIANINELNKVESSKQDRLDKGNETVRAEQDRYENRKALSKIVGRIGNALRIKGSQWLIDYSNGNRSFPEVREVNIASVHLKAIANAIVDHRSNSDDEIMRRTLLEMKEDLRSTIDDYARSEENRIQFEWKTDMIASVTIAGIFFLFTSHNLKSALSSAAIGVITMFSLGIRYFEKRDEVSSAAKFAGKRALEVLDSAKEKVESSVSANRCLNAIKGL